MIYSIFNQYIKDRFFNAAPIGSHIVLSVDKQIIDDFCDKESTSEHELRKEFQRLFSEHWDFALAEENFFGLAAIQVYVANQMGDEHISDKEISARNYRDRLVQYLNVSLSTLNRFFKTDEDQDKLWGNIKNWAEKNDFILGLPEKNEGPWSKVKYPLSQSLLNQQDLKHLPKLFQSAGLNPFEQFCFDDFMGLVEKAENNIILPNHFTHVKCRLEKLGLDNLLYKQIFEYYSNWDGRIIFEVETDRRQTRKQDYKEQPPSIFYNHESQEIHVFNNQSAFVKISINTRDVFQKIKKHFNPPNKNVLFFIKDEYYGDWKFSRYLVKGEQNLMISTNDEALEYLAKRIDANCQITNKLSCVITILRIGDDYEPNSFWENYFPKVSLPVKIINGLKLNRKQWMYQAGPDLSFSQPIDAWINGERISTTEELPIISLRYCESGLYVLKIRGFIPIRIEIDNPTFENKEISNGWHISKKPALWNPNSEPFQICGLVNSFTSEQASNSEIRDWIDVNTNRFGTTKSQYNDQITNALNRAKNGIRY